MDSNIIKGRVKEIRGKIKETWGDLTDNDLTRFKGKREELEGLIQVKYGYTRQRAVHEVRHFLKKLKD